MRQWVLRLRPLKNYGVEAPAVASALEPSAVPAGTVAFSMQADIGHFQF